MDKFLFEYLGDACFTFTYKSNSDDKTTVITFKERDDVNDYQYVIDGEDGGEVDPSDYASCFDWDDVASVLSEKFIKDSETTIKVEITNDDNGYDGKLTLKQDGSQIQDEPEYKLTLTPNIDMYSMDILPISDDSIEDIDELFSDEDIDGLYDYVWDNMDTTISYLPLYGNEDDETLDYEITDDNGNTIDEGTLPLRENNVFNYRGVAACNDIITNKEKYILIHTDVYKHPYQVLDIPKGFNINELHFMREEPFDDDSFPNYQLEDAGDTPMSLYGAHYHGVELEGESGDNGTYGDNKFYLFEFDESKKKYELVAEVNTAKNEKNNNFISFCFCFFVLSLIYCV